MKISNKKISSPFVSVVGNSGSGKTTFLEKLSLGLGKMSQRLSPGMGLRKTVHRGGKGVEPTRLDASRCAPHTPVRLEGWGFRPPITASGGRYRCPDSPPFPPDLPSNKWKKCPAVF